MFCSEQIRSFMAVVRNVAVNLYGTKYRFMDVLSPLAVCL
ncbi:hypothetical protein HMPREF1990_01654 [Porphyromonas gingivalis W4087]|nr:hypothetical protein A343_1299 [Porphyromonas gingivalis JCVI SC001]ERJ87792.1 hypothetical protein HMPREF1990_01654 [Porphyromonas gingivalis W4087]ERJ88238.1 hypothetical protein HMPREF1989_00386 [Porphyromonas gingivalis F0566]